jgi:hypothetical protein
MGKSRPKKRRSRFLNFSDALPEKSYFYIPCRKCNLHSALLCYRRVFGPNYLASYWSGQQALASYWLPMLAYLLIDNPALFISNVASKTDSKNVYRETFIYCFMLFVE